MIPQMSRSDRSLRSSPIPSILTGWGRYGDSNQSRSVGKPLRGFGDRAIDPAHHAAKLLTGLLDRVRRALGPPLGEVRPPGVVLGDPLAGELARLDLGQDPAHLVLHPGVDDPRAARVVAVLGGVRHAV